MTIWFTSDLHLGHGNIIKYCRRPFAGVRAMDDALRYAWQERVAKHDMVYILGDVSFHGADWTQHLVETLPGNKILIAGNHDSAKIRKLPCWSAVHEHIEAGREFLLPCGSAKFPVLKLCHYPPHFNGIESGLAYLHGHLHGTKAFDGKHPVYDVGVDANNYAPVALETILEKLEKL
jgi:calcineurin-like phosphoesterase family protein